MDSDNTAPVPHSSPQELLERGLALCRGGDWERGLECLGQITEGAGLELPGVFYSYLGHGIARCEGRVAEGLRLCRHGVKVEFYQPENYLNLARVYLLGGNRQRAWASLEQGLKVDRRHPGLRRLLKEMGARKRPVIPFLHRDNPLNRLLGRLRHQVRVSKDQQKLKKRKREQFEARQKARRKARELARERPRH